MSFALSLIALALSVFAGIIGKRDSRLAFFVVANIWLAVSYLETVLRARKESQP
jgi:cytochrome b